MEMTNQSLTTSQVFGMSGLEMEGDQLRRDDTQGGMPSHSQPIGLLDDSSTTISNPNSNHSDHPNEQNQLPPQYRSSFHQSSFHRSTFHQSDTDNAPNTTGTDLYRSSVASDVPRMPHLSIGMERSGDDYHLMTSTAAATTDTTATDNTTRGNSFSSVRDLLADSTEQAPSHQPHKPSSKDIKDEEDRYEAMVALSIQLAMIFFCALIVFVVFLSIILHEKYIVVIMVCLLLLVSVAMGLCCFILHIINEDDDQAPRVHPNHRPRWYRTVAKIIHDEIADFKDDWNAMCNGVLLLENGDAGDATANSSYNAPTANNEGMNQANLDATNYKNQPQKKRRGKSALFKLVAKPAALLVNLRRKRKEKKKQEKKRLDGSTLV